MADDIYTDPNDIDPIDERRIELQAEMASLDVYDRAYPRRAPTMTTTEQPPPKTQQRTPAHEANLQLAAKLRSEAALLDHQGRSKSDSSMGTKLCDSASRMKRMADGIEASGGVLTVYRDDQRDPRVSILVQGNIAASVQHGAMVSGKDAPTG